MLVDTQCGRLFVEVLGRGPDVVLWPSLLCDGSMWRYQVPALAAAHRVTVVDPPGHGRSSPLRRALTLDDCVAAAVTVLGAIDARAVAWCGLSWGGMVGMRLAARHPERVTALVLADTSARRPAARQRAKHRLLAAAARTIGPTRGLARLVVPEVFGEPAAHAADVERFVAGAMRLDRRSLGYAVDAVALRRDDVSHELPRIRAPTLVLVGEQDRSTPPSESEHLARSIPGARLVRLPRAGHLSAVEAPERVTAEIVQFLATAADAVVAPP